VAGIFGRYYRQDFWHWQFLFGDAHGASAIVEAGAFIRQQGGGMGGAAPAPVRASARLKAGRAGPGDAVCQRWTQR
jgi:hypothetical protein